MNYNKNININTIIIIISSIIVSSCVYFNTFYNADTYFNEAEKKRLEHAGEYESSVAYDDYKKVIEKSDKVLEKYPDSKYRDDALFLKGRAQYYRSEFEESQETFNTLFADYPDQYLVQTEYWNALIKWKTGKVQPALNDLKKMSNNKENEDIFAQIFLSRAEIYLELEDDSAAVIALEKAAEFTKQRREKGQIYYRLAENSFESENWEQAIKSYGNVTKYSFSKERILDANLKIVQSYRELGDLKTASKSIKSMLTDIDFENIHGDLKLELAKLSLLQQDPESAIISLDELTVDFPKTEVSAEAYYLLGEQSVLNTRDLEKAKYYYQQIQKEFSKSLFLKDGKQRIKELDQYAKSIEALMEFDKLTVAPSDSDSVAVVSQSDQQNSVEIPQHLYNLGELESFHFEKTDSGLVYFNRIINEFPESEIVAKTYFTLRSLHLEFGDSALSVEYENSLMIKFPDTEFADYIRANSDKQKYGISGDELLYEAEQVYQDDKEQGMDKYKIIAYRSNATASAKALLFLAHEYDYDSFEPDSAFKYYDEIQKRFPQSEQAKISIERHRSIKDLQKTSSSESQ